MPRIRTIKPDFWTSPQVVHVPVAARLLFIGTWTFADDNGNLPHDAEKLRLQVFPADEIDVEPLLHSLITQGLLSEYSVSGRRYLHINGFRDHQVINRPSRRSYPLPPASGETPASKGEETNSEISRESKDSMSTHGVLTEHSRMEEEYKTKTLKPKTKTKNHSSDRVPRARCAARFDARAYLFSLGVQTKLADDWLTLRRGKRLPPTETAITGVVREAGKAGVALNEIIRQCCERGWGGFRASWLEGDPRHAQGPPRAVSARDLRDERDRAMVATLTGRDPWEPPLEVFDLQPEDVRHVPDRRH